MRLWPARPNSCRYRQSPGCNILGPPQNLQPWLSVVLDCRHHRQDCRHRRHKRQVPTARHSTQQEIAPSPRATGPNPVGTGSRKPCWPSVPRMACVAPGCCIFFTTTGHPSQIPGRLPIGQACVRQGAVCGPAHQPRSFPLRLPLSPALRCAACRPSSSTSPTVFFLAIRRAVQSARCDDCVQSLAAGSQMP